jgi:hypothetical protein
MKKPTGYVEIDGATITATHDHPRPPFWDAQCCGWVFAEHINAGFQVLTAGGYTLDVDQVQSYTIDGPQGPFGPVWSDLVLAC